MAWPHRRFRRIQTEIAEGTRLEFDGAAVSVVSMAAGGLVETGHALGLGLPKPVLWGIFILCAIGFIGGVVIYVLGRLRRPPRPSSPSEVLVPIQESVAVVHRRPVPSAPPIGDPEPIAVPPQLPPGSGLTVRASGTVVRPPADINGHVWKIFFGTDIRSAKHVGLSFQPTALKLVSPLPSDPERLIRLDERLPAEWAIPDVGRLVVHQLVHDGFDVELLPGDVVVNVEIEAYAPFDRPEGVGP